MIPSDNNPELGFFSWQLDGEFTQPSQPIASSSSFPSLGTPATYGHFPTTLSRSQSTSHATVWQDDYRPLYNHSQSQPPADTRSPDSLYLHPGGQHTSSFQSLGTPAIYNPVPTISSRAQSTIHATVWQDGYRPLYNTSQSQPPADNRYAHSLYSQSLNPGGQHMEYTPNYPSTGNEVTPLAAPDLYEAPSQNEYFTNNGIPPPFDEESFTRRGAHNPCPWCFQGIPHPPCHGAPHC